MTRKLLAITILLGLLPLTAYAAQAFQVDTGGALTTSLQSYYKLENANDTYGSNNLTAAGDAAFPGFGKVNKGVALDGTDDYLDGGNAHSYTTSTPFSVAGWMYASTTAVRHLVSKIDWNNDRGYDIDFTDTGKEMRVNLTSSAANRNISDTVGDVITTGAWIHVAVTYSGVLGDLCAGVAANDALKIYINSALNDRNCTVTGLTGTLITTESFNVGAVTDGTATEFIGYIDEVGIWSKALTQTEINDLYNSGNGQTMIEVASAFVRRIILIFFQ